MLRVFWSAAANPADAGADAALNGSTRAHMLQLSVGSSKAASHPVPHRAYASS